MGDGVHVDATFSYRHGGKGRTKSSLSQESTCILFFPAFYISLRIKHKAKPGSPLADVDNSPYPLHLPKPCLIIWAIWVFIILGECVFFKAAARHSKGSWLSTPIVFKTGLGPESRLEKKTHKPVSCRRPDGVSPTFSSPSSFRLMTSRSKSVLSPLLLLNRTRPVSPSQWACKEGSPSNVNRHPRQPNQPDQWKPQTFFSLLFLLRLIRISGRPSADNIMRNNGRPWV